MIRYLAAPAVASAAVIAWVCVAVFRQQVIMPGNPLLRHIAIIL